MVKIVELFVSDNYPPLFVSSMIIFPDPSNTLGGKCWSKKLFKSEKLFTYWVKTFLELE